MTSRLGSDVLGFKRVRLTQDKTRQDVHSSLSRSSHCSPLLYSLCYAMTYSGFTRTSFGRLDVRLDVSIEDCFIGREQRTDAGAFSLSSHLAPCLSLFPHCPSQGVDDEYYRNFLRDQARMEFRNQIKESNAVRLWTSGICHPLALKQAKHHTPSPHAPSAAPRGAIPTHLNPPAFPSPCKL